MSECRRSEDANFREKFEAILSESNSFVSHFIRGTDALLDERAEEAVEWLEKSHGAAASECICLEQSCYSDFQVKSNQARSGIATGGTGPSKAPGSSEFRRNKGQIFLLQKKWNEAIREFEQVVGVESFRDSASQGLAIAYRQIGSEELAVLFEKGKPSHQSPE